jgi:hypothetical protein
MTAVDTFDIDPGFEFVRTSMRNASQSAADRYGVVLCRQINERQVRVFSLNWQSVPAQVLTRIRQIADKAFGPVGRVNFTPPGESQLEVCFTANTIKDIQRTATDASLTVELEEAL